jgi:hypothetical protein
VASPELLKFVNFVLFLRKTAKTSKFAHFQLFFHTLHIEDGALTINLHVVYARAFVIYIKN